MVRVRVHGRAPLFAAPSEGLFLLRRPATALVLLDFAGQDPTLFCCAFKKSRFFLFTRREPEEPEGDMEMGRDVFNEKPSKEVRAPSEMGD